MDSNKKFFFTLLYTVGSIVLIGLLLPALRFAADSIQMFGPSLATDFHYGMITLQGSVQQFARDCIFIVFSLPGIIWAVIIWAVLTKNQKVNTWMKSTQVWTFYTAWRYTFFFVAILVVGDWALLTDTGVHIQYSVPVIFTMLFSPLVYFAYKEDVVKARTPEVKAA